MRVGLLEGLEQRVGRRGHHLVRGIDECHLPATVLRAHRQRPTQLAHLVDEDLRGVTFALPASREDEDPVEIPARGVADGGRDTPGERMTPHAGRTAEQQRVGQTALGVARNQRPPGPGMPRVDLSRPRHRAPRPGTP